MKIELLGGKLEPKEAFKIANYAQKRGKGYIEITSKDALVTR